MKLYTCLFRPLPNISYDARPRRPAYISIVWAENKEVALYFAGIHGPKGSWRIDVIPGDKRSKHPDIKDIHLYTRKLATRGKSRDTTKLEGTP